MTTRFDHVAIGQFFFVVYPVISSLVTVRAYQKKSLSTAYNINPETWERIGDKHNFVEISKAFPVVAIAEVN